MADDPNEVSDALGVFLADHEPAIAAAVFLKGRREGGSSGPGYRYRWGHLIAGVSGTEAVPGLAALKLAYADLVAKSAESLGLQEFELHNQINEAVNKLRME